MNKQRFIDIIREEDHIEPSDLESLKVMADQYPFSQVLHTLIVKGATDLNRDEAKVFLPKAAMYTTDRQVLRSILQTPRTIRKAKNIPVKEPEVSKAPEKQPETTRETPKAEQQVTVEPAPQKPIADTPVGQRSSENLRHELMASLKELMNSKKVFFASLKRNTPIKSTLKTSVKKVSKESANKTPTKTAAQKKAAKTASKTSKKTTTTSTKAKKPAVAKAATQATKAKPRVAAKDSAKKSEKASVKKSVAAHKPLAQKEQLKLIDDFIKKQPSLTAGNEDRLRAETAKAMQDLSLKSVEFGEDLVSENLARILGEQGKTQKAIDIYKKLIWKFPQKKAYFASQIEKLTES